MELGNSEAIKHAVRHGLGISCLSRRVIAEQLASGTLAELKVPLPRLTRTLWRIHHRQKHISKALQRFFCTIARCSSPVLSPDYGGNSLAIPQVSALLIICGRS
ncbi:LysR family transcriptional regulator YeiE [Klebsiella pneumoniae IS53]|nr:LysR family transcriptional regulator YeiE [Klebsiella pneumoniae IS53]